MLIGQVALIDYRANNKRRVFLRNSSQLLAASGQNIISVDPTHWMPLVKTEKPKILDAKTIKQEAFNILELKFSTIVKVVKLRKVNNLIQFKIEPSIEPINFNIWRKLKGQFKNFSINQLFDGTEITLESGRSFKEPFTDIDPLGNFRLFIPYKIKDLPYDKKRGEKIAKGIIYYKDRVCVTQDKFTNLHILRISPEAYKNRIVPVLANEGIARRETLSSMIKRRQALMGINAGYFTSRGDPLGTLIINRKLVSSPLYDRSVFGITDENQVVFGNPKFSGFIKTGVNSTAPIDAINQPRRGDRIVIYTPEYAKSTLTELPGIELVLIKGKVCGIQKMNAPIPPDGIVISAGGDKSWLFNKIKLGDSIKLDYSVAPPWNTIKHAICGGPRLIKNGEISITYKEERFAPNIANARHPRTAIGLSVDNSLIMLVVEGRTSQSIGMTLNELALYMKRLGIRHGINLDGGGSSTMVVKNRMVNQASDGSERPISNGILLLKN